MVKPLSIAILQTNTTVGDVAGNVALIRQAWQEAEAQGADLLVTSEMAISGYPCEDLVLRRVFQEEVREAVLDLARATESSDTAILVGAPWVEDGRLYNSALLLEGGQLAAVRHKRELPNYGVFDEKRLFTPGPLSTPIDFRRHRLGVLICEDIWQKTPAQHLAREGAEMFIVLNSSPLEGDKHNMRQEIAAQRARETGLAIAYANQVGGQDELVFDGGSFVLDAEGSLYAQACFWRPDMLMTQWQPGSQPASQNNKRILTPLPMRVERPPSQISNIYQALMTGLRDYVDKNDFAGVILGLSGGIDSGLSACIAVDALGPDRVRPVLLPSPYNSAQTREDALVLCQNLGVEPEIHDISDHYNNLKTSLQSAFTAAPDARTAELARQNLQSRLRGLILMTLSNLSGHMVLTTGNKSELSTGYTTLYGDMCGGYNVLKDVYKTMVYKLADWRNTAHPPESFLPDNAPLPIIPTGIITRPPSAELAHNQTDQDSLPPYEILDELLEAYIDQNKSIQDILEAGFDPDLVEEVWRLVSRSEFKRWQAPPGVKVTQRAFGKDRRYPITNKFLRRSSAAPLPDKD